MIIKDIFVKLEQKTKICESAKNSMKDWFDMDMGIEKLSCV